MNQQSYINLPQKKTELMGNYIAGLVEGEGCFSIAIYKNKKYKIKYHVYPSFTIQMHIRELPLLKKVQNVLQCGRIYYNERDNTVNYKIYKQSDLLNKVIPFFNKYQFHGCKKHSFEIFKEIMLIISTNKHTTQEGINRLFFLKDKINKFEE